ncbi:MAG TPA: precorrin-4 C(11)-methyltransferase [Nitrososphaeraceae archaeon]|jgi:precorrin-4/cobalt-precorrin-4 C11-methyltransferase
MIDAGTVYFVGSGPGDPDLITLRAKKLVETADVIVYSGSLLNPEILKFAKKNAELIDAALIDRERIYEILRDSTKQGKLAIRFHDGDPSLFSTIREQIDKLERDQLHCKVVPGITALLAAASELNTELTLPGITQTIIITRAESRTPVPERERIAELGKHGATIAFYLSIHLISEIVNELLSGGVYNTKTPAVVVFRATWKDQIIVRGELGNIVSQTRKAKITKTAIVIVGDALAPRKYEFSKVYDPKFTHGFRKASN